MLLRFFDERVGPILAELYYTFEDEVQCTFPTDREQQLALAYAVTLDSAKEFTLLLSREDTMLGEMPRAVCTLLRYLQELIVAPTSSLDLQNCAVLFRGQIDRRFGKYLLVADGCARADVQLCLLCAYVLPGEMPFLSELLGAAKLDFLYSSLVEDAVGCYAMLRGRKVTSSSEVSFCTLAFEELRMVLSQAGLAERLASNGLTALDYYREVEAGTAAWLTESEKGLKECFQYVSPYIRLLLSVPPSSVKSEKAFSSASFIQDGRERLSFDSLEKLIFVRDFLTRMTPPEVIAAFDKWIAAEIQVD